jgi:peptide/nickel transport system substrate-binding protein
VWVTEKDAGRITRIEPTTERQTSIPVGGSPQGAIAAQGRLWVAVAGGAPETHRGGTLTVAAAALPGSGPANLDPAQVYAILTGWPERLVYQGLAALRYSGQDSYGLVPNLATRLPRASDGGRTYTFQIRRGVKYSTGGGGPGL